MVDTIRAERGPYNLSSGNPLQQQQEQCATGSEALVDGPLAGIQEDCAQTLALLRPEHRQQLRQRAEGAYTDAIIDWLVLAGHIRSISHQEANSDFRFSRTKQTQTGGILICHEYLTFSEK